MPITYPIEFWLFQSTNALAQKLIKWLASHVKHKQPISIEFICWLINIPVSACPLLVAVPLARSTAPLAHPWHAKTVLLPHYSLFCFVHARRHPFLASPWMPKCLGSHSAATSIWHDMAGDKNRMFHLLSVRTKQFYQSHWLRSALTFCYSIA